MRNLNTTTTPTKSLKKNRTSGAVSAKNGATCDCWVDGKLKFKRILVKLKKYVK